MASFADRIVALRNDLEIQTLDTPGRAAALAALDAAATALGAAAAEERAEAALLAKVSLDTLPPKEADVWIDLARVKAAAAREAEAGADVEAAKEV